MLTGCVPRLTRGHSFFWVAKRKKPKKRRPPRSAAGFAGCPALLVLPGGCGTRAFGPQTVLADYPRPHSVARRCTRGGEKPSASECACDEIPMVFNQPFASSSSARRNGKKGEDCLRTEGPSSAALPLRLSSAEHPAQPGDAVGATFLCLLSFGKTKESNAARQARKPTHQPPHTTQTTKEQENHSLRLQRPIQSKSLAISTRLAATLASGCERSIARLRSAL